MGMNCNFATGTPSAAMSSIRLRNYYNANDPFYPIALSVPFHSIAWQLYHIMSTIDGLLYYRIDSGR